MRVDLDHNTIDGRPLPGAVVEMAHVLLDGPVPTERLIARLYGVNEPGDARNAVRQRAFLARRLGVPINGNRTGGRAGSGVYRLG